MTRSVDIVVVGATAEAVAAAIQSARRGDRVLMVIRSRAAEARRQLRRSVRAADASASRRISILSGAEIQCVAGVGSVEAVLFRRIDTNQCVGVNTSALVNLESTARS